MFSQESRRLFHRSPIMEVICQFRFPEILSIGAHAPADFQEIIRQEFPQYRALKEKPVPRLSGAPGNYTIESPDAVVNYQFLDTAGHWKVNLTSKFISLSCNSYTVWEDFAKKLDLPLAAFIKTYQPAYFERVGLRYINAFSRQALDLEGVPFRELFQPCYLGALAEDDVEETLFTRSATDLEMNIPGGTHARVHAGLGMIKKADQSQDKEVRFILDNDLSMGGNIPANHSAGVLQTLHQQADSLFLGALTPRLMDAMGAYEYL